MSDSRPRCCAHGRPVDGPYCPDCKAMRDRAAERIKANGGVSPRRMRARKERGS